MATQQIPFKLFGLQGTCTNVVRFTLMQNFHVRSVEIGTEWKHGPIAKTAHRTWNGQHARIVCCVRNPYAWMRSCYRYFSRHKGADVTVCRRFDKAKPFGEFVVGPHYDWPSPAVRWNVMNARWLDYVDAHPDRSIVVHSEDLMGIKEQVGELRRIGAHFGLTQKEDRIRALRRRITNLNRRINVMMDFDYYQREAYLQDYDRSLLEFVNSHLDWNLMNRFGYQRRDFGDVLGA